MATDPRAQHYIECTHCNKNAEYYCNTCTDKLCSECKVKHSINQVSKHHEVVLYREKQMSAPTAELCQIHPNLLYVSCCHQCEVPVCKKCITEKHKKHFIGNIKGFFEKKNEEFQDRITKIRNQLIPKCTGILRDVQSDGTMLKNEIAKIHSAMTSKAQTLKDIIDIVLNENTKILQGLENSLITELQHQETLMKSHITYLQNILDDSERYIMTNQPAMFILFQQKNPLTKLEEIPELTEINLPSFNVGEVKKEDIAKIIGKPQESTKPAVRRKVRNMQQAVKKNDTTMIPIATKITSFAAPGVDNSCHISPVTSDKVWISDDHGNLVLSDVKGMKLNDMNYALNRYGCHTMSDTGELIFLLEDGIYKVTANIKTPTLITEIPHHDVDSIYSSPSNGDILVGIRHGGQGLVIRYKTTGQEVHQIQYDNTGQPLYDDPHYITENQINGDVCVSDLNRHAVVVVDRHRCHHFSYTGHPPGSELMPFGISTDTHGHILVCDQMSDTVQITDKDGHFLSFLLTTGQGIETPLGLSLDIRNNLLWVGSCDNNTVAVYKYNQNSKTRHH